MESPVMQLAQYLIKQLECFKFPFFSFIKKDGESGRMMLYCVMMLLLY